jgi:hypothetical protein
MRFKQIIETTTAGSVATVAQPMMTQTRENVNVPGLKPVQKLMKGTKKKNPYANSIAESKVTEDDLAEQDLIVIPGQGRLRKTGFVKHDLDQGEHEGHTLKNSLHTIARAASDLDKRLSVQSEFPEWVSEKIGAAKGMMVTVMDYLISSQEMQHDRDAMNEGEVSTSNLRTMYDLARMAKNYCNPEGQESLTELLKILKWYMDQAEQNVTEGSQRVDSIVTDALRVMKGPEISDAVLALKRVLGDRAYNERRGFYSFYVDQIHRNWQLPMYGQQGMAEGRVAQLPTQGADYSKYDTDHLKIMLRPGILHRNEARFKALIRKELQKREQQGQQGVAEDDSALQAFLSKGGNVQQLPYKKPRKADKTDYGSRHIGGGGDKMKASRTGTAANTQGSKVAGMREAFDLGDLRKAAGSSRSSEDERALKRNPDFGKLMQKSVNKHNKAVVKTKQDIGSRIADIGAGGKEYNVKTDAAWDAANKTVEEGWKSKLAGAALAGAAALGGGGAQAQNAPTGADNLPSIVAQIAFQVDGKSVTKDINLGTQYQTPGHASQAVKDFMKSKGIKFYNFTLQRVAAQPPLVTPDEMNASNQEYQRQHDSNNLSNTPYSAKGDEPARLQTDKGYTSSSRPNASITYEGSVPKEKQKTPFVDRNSPESQAKIQAARDKAAKDKAAEPGKKLADKIDKKK